MPTKNTKKPKQKVDNTVFVGSKPVMTYVLAVVTQINNGPYNQVTIKARGRAISRAVDTAEIVRNKFVKNLIISEIKIGTESVKNEKGLDSNVSTIEICLLKKN
ncbi:MAG: DNA-binding protein Alba [Candidatus Thermoplasmatota archaeon]|nr:DNA-binding protein Alba [Candidatus Thermoplasmatota archaeon]